MRLQQGSVAIIAAFAIFIFVLAVGIAVDMARAQILQSKIQSALDASGLAAVASLQSKPANIEELEWIRTQTKRFFDVNFNKGYLDTTQITPTVELDTDGQSYILTALSQQSTTFMTLAGIDQVNVGATSKVTRKLGGQGMELVLVLDNTLSMAYDLNTGGYCDSCSTSKMAGLKDAANNLLDILYGADNDTAPGLYVGVVPFSQTVNITGRTNFLNSSSTGTGALTSYDWGPDGGSWGGCVMARPAPDDLTDKNPGEIGGGFDVYWYPYDVADTQARRDYLFESFNYFTNLNPSPAVQDNAWPKYGWRLDNPDGTFNSYKPVSPVDFSSITQGPNLACPQPIMPMVTSKASVKNAINSMIAYGETFISEGAVWGWRMLSPNWRGFWGGEMDALSLPLDYNLSSSRKVVVLISDGYNNFSAYNYTTYGWLWDYALSNGIDPHALGMSGDFGGTVNAVSALMDAKTEEVCKSMKNQGIIIYTIGFGIEGPKFTPTGEINNMTMNSDLLKKCATSPDNYFYAPSNADLKNSFRQIATSLVNLRISK